MNDDEKEQFVWSRTYNLGRSKPRQATQGLILQREIAPTDQITIRENIHSIGACRKELLDIPIHRYGHLLAFIFNQFLHGIAYLFPLERKNILAILH